jgi:energy-converting hydrogenase Eha subunit A
MKIGPSFLENNNFYMTIKTVIIILFLFCVNHNTYIQVAHGYPQQWPVRISFLQALLLPAPVR